MVEKKRRKGGSRGEEVGKGGGWVIPPNVLEHTRTNCTESVHCRLLPWENPRPISQGGAFFLGHVVGAASWALVNGFKLW